MRQSQFPGLDSRQSMFLEEQLTAWKPMIEKALPELKLLRKIPITQDSPVGAATIKLPIFSLIGSAKIIASAATDIPKVDTDLTEIDVPVREVADSFTIMIREIENASMAGINLSDKKMLAALRAMDQELNRILREGDTANGLTGILNNAYIPKITNPSGVLWTRQTDPEDILDDVETLLETPFILSNSVEMADTVLFPSTYWSIIRGKKVGTLDSKTILTHLRETYPDVDFDYIPDFNSVTNPRTGSGLCPVAFAFTARPEKLGFEMPLRNQMLPVQPKGLGFETIMRSLTGGLLMPFPLSAAIMDFTAH